MIAARLPITLYLGLASLVAAAVVGLPLGWLAARSRERDTLSQIGGGAVRIAAVIVESTPVFWAALLLLVFALTLGLSPNRGFGLGIQALALPVAALAPIFAVAVARMTASVLLAQKSSSGGERYPPSASAAGVSFGILFTAWAVIEVLFVWPGIGRLLVSSINARDYPVIGGVILNLSLLYVGLVFIIESLYGCLILLTQRRKASLGADSSEPPAIRPESGSISVRPAIPRAPALLLGALVLVGIIIAATAPVIAPHDPLRQNLADRFVGPGEAGYILGTDALGRDIFSRLLHSVLPMLIVLFPILLLALLPGFLLALLAVRTGGRLENVVMFLADIEAPPIVTAALIVSVLDNSYPVLILALLIWALPYSVRLIRDEAFTRASDGRTGLALAPLLGSAAALTGMVILAQLILSFLGVGVAPPTPDWGAMVADSFPFITAAPMMFFSPGLAAFLTLVVLNFSADWLRRGWGRASKPEDDQIR